MLIPLRLSALSDEQPMLRAARDSNRAFEELYNRHARRLQGFFARQLGDDRDLAADFMHDAFLRLYDARTRYREGSSFRAWLYAIAYNLCKNQYRHLEHEQNYLMLVYDDANDDVSDVADIELEMDEETLHKALREVLLSLPEPYAMLFSLHYEEELTVPQIAQITGLPEGTVKSRLHKVMMTIKQKLKQYED